MIRYDANLSLIFFKDFEDEKNGEDLIKEVISKVREEFDIHCIEYSLHARTENK